MYVLVAVLGRVGVGETPGVLLCVLVLVGVLVLLGAAVRVGCLVLVDAAVALLLGVELGRIASDVALGRGVFTPGLVVAVGLLAELVGVCTTITVSVAVGGVLISLKGATLGVDDRTALGTATLLGVADAVGVPPAGVGVGLVPPLASCALISDK